MSKADKVIRTALCKYLSFSFSLISLWKVAEYSTSGEAPMRFFAKLYEIILSLFTR